MTQLLLDKLIETEGKLCGVMLKQPSLVLEYEFNKALLSKDGLMYIQVLDRLLSRGIEVIDEVSFFTEVENIGGDTFARYKKSGGFNTIIELMSIVDVANVDHILDEWNKYRLVQQYENKGVLNVEMHWNKIVAMNSSQIVDYLENQIAHVDIDVCSDFEFESLAYTDAEIAELQAGVNLGLSYSKHSPLLNYLTLGVARSNLYLFGGYTNSGKSSFIFQNMIIPIAEGKHKCCVISNEQKSDAFKVLLQIHVLTERLNYWNLTRKKIKSGQFNTEDLIMMKKARDIIKKEYDPYITFVKLYNYNTKQVNKIVKKLSKQGFECFLYDTFKVSDGGDGAAWERILADSKDLFQIASKNNVAIIMSVQLSLHTKNKVRWLDEGVLSNGKQMAEVVETGVYMRDLWGDEWFGETYDIKPYVLKRDANGKYTSEREEVALDRTKKYKIMFLSKTRADENGQAIIYEFRGEYNKWIELARCTPGTKNMY